MHIYLYIYVVWLIRGFQCAGLPLFIELKSIIFFSNIFTDIVQTRNETEYMNVPA